LDFGAGTEESAYCNEHIPFRWDETTDIVIEVYWFHDTADTGGVVWGIEYLSIADGEAVAGTTATIIQASGGNHPAGELQKTVFTSTLAAANLAHGDMLALRLFRDVGDAADTLGEDARVVNVNILFVQNRLGKSLV